MAAATRALSALRLDTIPRLPPVLALSSRSNSNRTSISHLHRQLYGRLYPVLLVKADGSTVRLRYKEPKRILMLPLDSNTLPEAERKARLRRQFPSKPKAGPEDTFEGIDLGTYERFWKKSPTPHHHWGVRHHVWLIPRRSAGGPGPVQLGGCQDR